MLCFFSLVSRAEMSLSISANTNFYEYIQMQFLHIVVETVLNSRQRTFLDLVDRFFLQRESDRFSFVNGTLALPSIGLRWSCNIHISDTSINQQRKHRPMFTFVVAKLIFGNLKVLVLISGSELGLSVTEPKKLSHHSMSHLWDSLSCHFSKIERILGFWSAVTS